MRLREESFFPFFARLALFWNLVYGPKGQISQWSIGSRNMSSWSIIKVYDDVLDDWNVWCGRKKWSTAFYGLSYSDWWENVTEEWVLSRECKECPISHSHFQLISSQPQPLTYWNNRAKEPEGLAIQESAFQTTWIWQGWKMEANRWWTPTWWPPTFSSLCIHSSPSAGSVITSEFSFMVISALMIISAMRNASFSKLMHETGFIPDFLSSVCYEVIHCECIVGCWTWSPGHHRHNGKVSKNLWRWNHRWFLPFVKMPWVLLFFSEVPHESGPHPRHMSSWSQHNPIEYDFIRMGGKDPKRSKQRDTPGKERTRWKNSNRFSSNKWHSEHFKHRLVLFLTAIYTSNGLAKH